MKKDITRDRMVEAALDGLERLGFTTEQMDYVKTVAETMFDSGKYIGNYSGKSELIGQMNQKILKD